MIRLKHILQYNLVLAIFVLITIIYVSYMYIHPIKSKYDLETKSVQGYVLSYKIDGNELSIDLKGLEKIKVKYIFKTIDEKNNCYLKVGDYLDINGTINIPNSNTNDHLFNYYHYLLGNNIKYLFKADDYHIAGYNKLYNLYNHIKDKIMTMSHKEYLMALILGDTNYLDYDTKSMYIDNGISQILNISGIHLILISSFINKLLKRIKYHSIISIVILFLYAFLTGFSLSFVRALILYTLSLIMPNKRLKCFIITLCLFLIYNPYYLYNIGFLYSFTISFFLIIFKLPKKYKLIYLSLTSFIVSIPIMLSTNFSFNLLSPLISLILMPFSTYILFPIFWLSMLINLDNLVNILINIMESFISLISPFNISLNFCYPGLLLILYYISIWYTLKLKRPFILIVLFINLIMPHMHTNPIIEMIDVGQGDSILIEMPYSFKTILIDTGGTLNYKKDWTTKDHPFDIGESIVMPYLKSRGINKLDYLILSHGDADHMQGSLFLASNFNIDRVIFNQDDYNDLEQELINILNIKKIKYSKGLDELLVDNNKLYFLNTKMYDNENDNSNVIYFKYQDTKMLFMGDASVVREKDIIDKYDISDIAILKVGHHGSDSSTSKYFVDKINPKTCLISVGKNNRYGHPKDSVLKTLSDCEIYRTDEEGNIEINDIGYKLNLFWP